MEKHDYKRTVCSCHDCKACCKRQPGPLAAGDWERIREHLGLTDDEMRHKFWASPGALVKNLITGATMRIGSITPQRKRGKCVFLDDDERCTIHAVAPFGCAMFDTHMGYDDAQERSAWLARSQLDPEYQRRRKELPYATSYRPKRY